jgi:uncharacterized protein
MLNKSLKVLASKTGKGVFTSVDITANTPIIEFTGTIYKTSELPDPNHPAILQVGQDTFIGPSGAADDYINHSCNPNCLLKVLGNRAILHSMYFIKAHSELTFDYSTTSTDTHEIWKMTCQCGQFNCRKVISGYQYLDENTKSGMLKKGMIPMFMTSTLFR